MKFKIQKSTNPNTGEEVLKLRAEVQGKDIEVLLPTERAANTPEKQLKAIAGFEDPQWQVREGVYGKYLLVYPKGNGGRETIKEVEIAM